MQGSIRFIAGLLITFGAAGGVEASTDTAGLLASMAAGLVGVMIAASGAKAARNCK